MTEKLLSSPATPFQLDFLPVEHRSCLQELDSVEAFLEGLNRSSPGALRRVRARAKGGCDSMWLATVARADPNILGESFFMVEAQCSIGLDVHTLNAELAPAALSICLPLSGGMRLKSSRAEFFAAAGHGLVIDPAEVDLTQVLEDTHFLEFHLPKALLQRLLAEIPGSDLSSRPRFRPELNQALSSRLLFMALQSAASLRSPPDESRCPGMFRRWSELIAMTLLNEQPFELASAGRGRQPVRGRHAQACLRRALDYMDGHALEDMSLADVAEAACVSTSSLLRLFKAQFDLTPSAYMRQIRLDKARTELLHDECASVRELAQRWGFQNASKFAQAYRRRFGELPSATSRLASQ